MASPHKNNDLYAQDAESPSEPSSGAATIIILDDSDCSSDSNPIPTEPRSASASPLPPIPSQERRSFDHRIHQAHTERTAAATADSSHQDRMKHMFDTELEWRKYQYHNAWQQRSNHQPYRLLRPWSVEMREQCVAYPSLLDMYYGLEALTLMHLRERLGDMRRVLVRGMMGGMEEEEEEEEEVDEKFYFELEMLTRVESARDEDMRAGNDRRVLMKVVDGVEKRLHAQIEMRFGGDEHDQEEEEVQESVTELPRSIFMTVMDHPEVLARLMALRDTERALYPSRFDAWLESPAGSDGGVQLDHNDRKRPSPTTFQGSPTKKTKGETEGDMLSAKPTARKVC